MAPRQEDGPERPAQGPGSGLGVGGSNPFLPDQSFQSVTADSRSSI